MELCFKIGLLTSVLSTLSTEDHKPKAIQQNPLSRTNSGYEPQLQIEVIRREGIQQDSMVVILHKKQKIFVLVHVFSSSTVN